MIDHNEPQQVFVADGGHYCNLGIVPLLRRRCTKICAVDAADDRSLHDILSMISSAERDLGTKISLGRSEFGEKTLSDGLNDFILPRCIVNIHKMFPNVKSSKERQLLISEFFRNALFELQVGRSYY